MSGFFSSSVAFSSADDTWTTPPDLFERLNTVYNFALDAAALNSSTLVAGNYYAPDHPQIERRDAFLRDWAEDSGGGAVWLNPPYGRKIGKWMRYAVSMSRRGCIVVCLVPARTDTAWFHDTAFACGHIEFLRGRLKFGGSKNCAPFPSAIVTFGSQTVDSDTPTV